MSKSLTLGKLSEYDDLLTDHLIDKVYYWIKTHKADRYKNHSSRRAKTQDIVDILQTHVIPCKNNRKLDSAVEAFLQLKSARKFCSTLDTYQQRDFQRHLKKYLSIYLPSAGFEICSTNRYPGPKAESCILANRNLKAGEILDCLTGTIVPMTEEEEDYYEAEHDFSILHSSRLDSMCLFLGPARFVNHDCEPNGTFVTQGGSIAVTIVKTIPLGEEVTVFYSPDYFGPGNMDCLCATCERLGRGGYSSKHQVGTAANGIIGPIKKRNQVQTIEFETRAGKNRNASSKIPTPPESDSSADDPGRVVVEISDTESCHFSMDPYASESGDEDDCIVTMSLGGQPTSLQSKAGPEHAGPALRSSQQEVESIAIDALIRRGLRPRKTNFDYNLRRQSLLSLVPHHDDEDAGLPAARPRRARKPGVTYCTVCEEELSKVPDVACEARMQESQKNNSKKSMCSRCARHSKLYQDPWPKRTPIALARDLTPDSVRAPLRECTRLGRQGSTSPATESGRRLVSRTEYSPIHGPSANFAADSDLVGMETVKSQLKLGNIVVPRLLNKEARSDVRDAQSLDTSASWLQDITKRLESDSSVRQLSAAPEKTVSSSLMCPQCGFLFCKCLYAGASISATSHPVKTHVTENKLDRQSSQNRHATQSDARRETDLAAGKSCPIVKKRKTEQSLKIDRSTLNMKQSRSPTRSTSPRLLLSKSLVISPSKLQKQSASQPSNTAFAVDIESSSTRVPNSNKRASSGSWYYVEVYSSDTEQEEAVVLDSRTRSESKLRSSGKRAGLR